MNEIRTFKAQSMQEALAIVRRELGSDAVILNTRQVTHRRLLPFLKKRQQVEVQFWIAIDLLPVIYDLRIVLLQCVEVARRMQVLPEVPGVPISNLRLSKDRSRHDANPENFRLRLCRKQWTATR